MKTFPIVSATLVVYGTYAFSAMFLSSPERKALRPPPANLQEVRAKGVADPTYWEEVTVLGGFPVLSGLVADDGKRVRRIGFQNPPTKDHYEAVVNCDRPQIETGRGAHIYMRKNNRNGRVTFYVLCAIESPAPAAPSR